MSGLHPSWRVTPNLHPGTGGLAADFNGDGNDELFVPNFSEIDIWVRVDSALAPVGSWAISGVSGLYEVGVVGDVSGDGIDDLVLAYRSPGRVVVLEGGSLSGPRSVVTIPVGPGQPVAIELFDSGGDGDLDIVCGVSSVGGTMNIRLLRNDPGGWFLGPPSGSFSSQPAQVQRLKSPGGADLLAVFALGFSGVQIVSVDPATTLSTIQQSVAALAIEFVVADFDNDQFDDVVLSNLVVNPGGAAFTEIVVYSRQAPSSPFSAVGASLQIPSGHGLLEEVIAIDVDFDGFLDLVGASCLAAPSWLVLKNLAGNSFELVQSAPFHELNSIVDMKSALAQSLIIAFEKGGASGFVFSLSTSGALVPLEVATGTLPTEVTSGEVSGDSCEDLIWLDRDSTSSESRVCVTVRDAECQGWLPSVNIADVGSSNARNLEVTDLNGDGLLDVVGWYPPGTLFALIQEPAGWSLPIFSGYLGGIEFTPADLNQDGFPDVASHVSGQLYITSGDGGGGFGSPQWQVSSASGPNSSILAGDFDGDGLTDAFVAGVVPVVHWGEMGGVGPPEQLSLVSGVRAAVGLDSGVGNAQLALLLDGQLVILRANGNRQFDLEQTILVALSTVSEMQCGDLTGDGVEDILLVRPDGLPGVSVVLSDGSFGYFPVAGVWGAGMLQSATIVPVFPGSNSWLGVAVATGVGGSIEFLRGEFTGVEFVLGDFNVDESVDIADAISLLGWLFVDSELPSHCAHAADVNQDDLVDLADVLSLLGSLFGTISPSPDLFAGCVTDNSTGALSCFEYPSCE